MSTIHRIIEILLVKAEREMTRDELEQCADVTNEAAIMAKNLSKTLETMACMIGHDEHGIERRGYFQDAAAVSTLLSVIASNVDAIAGLTRLGDYASNRLRFLDTPLTEPANPKRKTKP